jgi:hypothetical protein
MKKLFFVLLAFASFLVASPAYAGAAAFKQDVYGGELVPLPTPPGRGTDVVIVTDGGVVRWNTLAVDLSYQWIISGNCVRDYVPKFNGVTYIGFTCAGPGQFHLQTTSVQRYTCPADGGILQDLHLTLTNDGETFYDQELWPNPITCYLTPAKQATATWQMPYVVFDNSGQARVSADTAIYVNDPAWLYSHHLFTVPAGISCAPSRKMVPTGTWVKKYVEIGFYCHGSVPAGGISTVTVN